MLKPIAFMARLVSPNAPLRYPLLRQSGVLAPHSSWRAAVVSGVPAASATRSSPKPPKSKPTKPGSGTAVAVSVERDGAPLAPPSEASALAAQSGPRTRLGTGVTKSVGARIDWASLLRRVYLEEVLACPCGGRRRLVADISEREVIIAILKHPGLPSEAPPIARARSPSCEAA
ncbi:hypothetical protein WMF18_36695 [Sorangium sp. So ce315]|uniref:hypothetical protein n=1 Tax=Sorangium sp. So ce315 TaxID=3133299 RepID=UPI003F5FCF0C